MEESLYLCLFWYTYGNKSTYFITVKLTLKINRKIVSFGPFLHHTCQQMDLGTPWKISHNFTTLQLPPTGSLLVYCCHLSWTFRDLCVMWNCWVQYYCLTLSELLLVVVVWCWLGFTTWACGRWHTFSAILNKNSHEHLLHHYHFKSWQ